MNHDPRCLETRVDDHQLRAYYDAVDRVSQRADSRRLAADAQEKPIRPVSFGCSIGGGGCRALATGLLAPGPWDWKKITFATGAGFALFVILTVPDHFLEQHLWEHVVKRHLSRIFLWSFGALLAIHYLSAWVDIGAWIQDNLYIVLIIALLVGIIPESGPHLVFVTLYAQGTIPLAILLANSIVQDGHGTLPLLAVSGRAFIWLKLVNILFGLMVGLLGLYALA